MAELARRVAGAALRRDEQHAGRADGSQRLGIVAGARNQLHGRQPQLCCCPGDGLLGDRAHRRRLVAAEEVCLQAQFVGLCHLPCLFEQGSFQIDEKIHSGSAQLKRQAGSLGYDIECAGDVSNLPYICHTIGKLFHYHVAHRQGKGARPQAGIPPVWHGSRAGMICPTNEFHLVRTDADDGADHSDRYAGVQQARPLFDVQFKVAGQGEGIASRLQQPVFRQVGACQASFQCRPAAAGERSSSTLSVPASAALPSRPTRVPSSSVKSIASR